MSAPAKARSTSTFSCAGCGEEMVVIDVLDDDEFDYYEASAEWERAHKLCGEAAEVVAWSALVDQGNSSVEWNVTDLEHVARVPRPSWAPAGRDSIRTALWASCFRSLSAAVALDHNIAADGLRSRFEVSAKRTALGDNQVGITLHKVVDGKWTFLGTNMTLDEARELRDVLAAALELAVSP